MPRHGICTQVTPECPVEATTYGYYPNFSVNTFFVALFGLLLILQIIFGISRRTWTYLVVVSIGCLGECIGYVGRLLMHHNPWSSTGFKIQICCLVLAPSFLAAGVYVTLKHLVIYCGPEYSRIKPRLYPWLFIGFDFFSIIVQAIGGGVAAAADTQSTNRKLLDAGDDLIVTGIAIQVATMAVCGVLMVDYFIRLRRGQKGATSTPVDSADEAEKPRTVAGNAWKFRMFCFAIGLSFITIFVRCVYR